METTLDIWHRRVRGMSAQQNGVQYFQSKPERLPNSGLWVSMVSIKRDFIGEVPPGVYAIGHFNPQTRQSNSNILEVMAYAQMALVGNRKPIEINGRGYFNIRDLLVFDPSLNRVGREKLILRCIPASPGLAIELMQRARIS